MSIVGSSRTATGSAVRSEGRCREIFVNRERARAPAPGPPTRRAMLSAFARSACATPAPTVPRPNMPTRITTSQCPSTVVAPLAGLSDAHRVLQGSGPRAGMAERPIIARRISAGHTAGARPGPDLAKGVRVGGGAGRFPGPRRHPGQKVTRRRVLHCLPLIGSRRLLAEGRWKKPTLPGRRSTACWSF